MKKGFKRSTVILLTVLMVAALSVTVFAAGRWVQAWQDDTLKIKFNGVTQTFTDPDDGSQIVPLVYNGRTYLPVRAIATLAGLGVDYDDASHSVLLTSGGSAADTRPVKDSENYNAGTTASNYTYTDKQLNISFDYKNTWTEKNIAGIPTFIAPNNEASFNIVTEDVPAGTDLNDYVSASINGIKKMWPQISDFTQTEITLDGKKAIRIRYTNDGMKFSQILCIVNNKAYVLTFSTQINKFDIYLDDANISINSFKFTSNDLSTTTQPTNIDSSISTGTASSNAGTITDPVNFGSSFSWTDESNSTSFGFRSNVTMSVTNVKPLTNADLEAMGYKSDSDPSVGYVLVSLNMKGSNVTPTTIDDYIYYNMTAPEIWGSKSTSGKYVIGGTNFGFDGSIEKNIDNRYPSGSNKINKGSSVSEIDYSGNVILPIIKGETNYLVMQKANTDLEYNSRFIYFKLN